MIPDSASHKESKLLCFTIESTETGTSRTSLPVADHVVQLVGSLEGSSSCAIQFWRIMTVVGDFGKLNEL